MVFRHFRLLFLRRVVGHVLHGLMGILSFDFFDLFTYLIPFGDKIASYGRVTFNYIYRLNRNSNVFVAAVLGGSNYANYPGPFIFAYFVIYVLSGLPRGRLFLEVRAVQARICVDSYGPVGREVLHNCGFGS